MNSFDRNEAANHQVTGEDDLTKAAGTKGSHELVSRRQWTFVVGHSPQYEPSGPNDG